MQNLSSFQTLRVFQKPSTHPQATLIINMYSNNHGSFTSIYELKNHVDHTQWKRIRNHESCKYEYYITCSWKDTAASRRYRNAGRHAGHAVGRPKAPGLVTSTRSAEARLLSVGCDGDAMSIMSMAQPLRCFDQWSGILDGWRLCMATTTIVLGFQRIRHSHESSATRGW